MARRSKAKKGLSDQFSGLLLGIVGLILLGGLAGGFWWVKNSRTKLDANNCPASGPRAIHVIMFDRSDPISEQQAQRIRQTIDRYRNEASFGQRFDLYTIQGDTQHVLQPRLQLCALGKPSDANALIENPELVRRAYEAKFAKVLDQAVAELLRGSQEKNSPIIESLRAASISSFGAVAAGEMPLRLTIISDMVQNTSIASQFAAEANFSQLSKSPAWATVQPQFKGANVEVLYLLRLSAQRKGAPIQNRGHQLFWEQLIGASGGKLDSFDPL